MTEQDATATARVLAIPELLELILLQLPIKDLLFFQRVARTWQRLILSSLHLRQTLFLSPIPPTTTFHLEQKPRSGSPDTTPSCSHAQRVRLTPSSTPPTPYTTRTEEQAWTHCASAAKATLNPLLLKPGAFTACPNPLPARLSHGESVVVLGKPRLQRLAGAGREMFLSQPPCTAVAIWLDWGTAKRIADPSGVRAGEVWGAIERAPELPYLPHVFMKLEGVVCPSAEEEGEVHDETMGKGRNDQ